MSELKNKNIWIHITFFSILDCDLGDRQFSENSDFRGMTDLVVNNAKIFNKKNWLVSLDNFTTWIFSKL